MTPEVKGHLKKKLRTWLRAQIISDMTSNMKISVTILEIWEFKVFFLASEIKFDLGGQRSFQQKVADLIYKVERKRLISIFKSVLRLLVYKVVILALKVKFDLGGQRSFWKKVSHLIYELDRKSFIGSNTQLFLNMTLTELVLNWFKDYGLLIF